MIGCGRVAHYHARALVKLEGAELVGVCDIVPERTDEFSRLYGGEAVHDYHRLLDRDDIDVVFIATPSGDHLGIGIDAAHPDKHVVIEKPIGLTLTEIDALIEACDNAGVKLCADHQSRFDPPIRKLRRALEEGWFGKLSHATMAVRWNRNQNYYEQAKWRGTWLQDDGVTATRFRSGARGFVEASNNVYPSNWEETLTIFGEHGSVIICGVAVNRVERWEFSDGSNGQDLMNEPDPASVYGSAHGPLLEAMIHATREDEDPPVTGQDGRAAVELVLAVYRSQETGSMMRFPLVEESERVASARGTALRGSSR